jgi:ketosteroid isomerase-like protein
MNINAAQNNDHQLIGIARHLLTHYKAIIEYQTKERIETSIARNFTILGTTLSGTLRSNLVERIKQNFDAILLAVIDGFGYESEGHQNAVYWKPSVQATFNSVVDFTINIESRLLKDKKQDLLGDIHTQLSNAITSEMLRDQLLPTFKFKSRFVLDEMINRQNPNYTRTIDTSPMKVRSTFNEEQLNRYAIILERVRRHFSSAQMEITMSVVLNMLLQKRERNDGKHYDSRIQAHIKTHQGRARQFRSFIESENLLRAFDDNEINQTQQMYAEHYQISSVDWHKRSDE